ncbi:cytochrome c biogenesis protein CcsA [Formosa haliotis]|uniref:cytochrome c biogenesis protein CcsA n=1 Tax=Formosa haliotis TaxID=1555194 RepID=UPI000824C335|nr:cytochrome c biogenesis protein CcsA [Formosa haliotis]
MNKLLRILFSPAIALVLLLIFAVSMAAATFIENDFSTQTARTLIYNAWWFEMVMLLLSLNFIANIFKYKLYRKGKIPVLLFHIAFVIIIIGAAITRFTAYEGIMRIREGATSNTIVSDRNFIQLHASTDSTVALNAKKEIYFSPLKDNSFTLEESLQDHDIEVSFKDFIADAKLDLKEVETGGENILQIVVSEGEGRENRLLKKGDVTRVGMHRHEITFDNELPEALNIREGVNGLEIKAPHDLSFFIMAEEKAGSLTPNVWHPMTLRTLYRMGDIAVVPMVHHKSAAMGWVTGSEKPKDNKDNIDDIVVLDVTVDGKTEEMELLYRHGFLPIAETKTINGVNVTVSYGATPILTPFTIKLDDFELERYPGSTSPSSYSSDITVENKAKNEAFSYKIYMNNVLDYGGYRFFQASYDTDEKGTVLAVNHDMPGTIVTYIGYFLMSLGMLWTLFGKGSRFALIQRKLKKLKKQKVITALLLLCTLSVMQANNIDKKTDSLAKTQIIDKHHASLFGRLMVQDLDGRIKPINSLASEFLRKISRRPYYKSESVRLDANQTFLALHANPEVWSLIPLIKIDPEKGGTIYKDLEQTSDHLVAFSQFIKNDGDYLLEQAVAEANTKKPAERSEFDKEMLKVDERFNILYNVFSGNYLKIFPLKDDPTKTWYSYSHDFKNFSAEDADFAKGILPIYFRDIYNAKSSGDWVPAENDLAYIKKYQEVLAPEIMPSSQHLEAELWYNELNAYFWLFQAYWTLGFVLLVIAISRIFSTKKYINTIFNVLVVITLVAFIIHTGNLALRWYVAQHAPWSNGYEMITFVAWSIMLFGIIFYKKSDFALPLATLFAGTLLFVSYLDWLSPEITNLMPVLKSYWLKIHVATIISSYAPLALSALLGFMAMLLIIFKTKKNAEQIDIRIKELTYINELSMTIGLFVLSIGTFLGGVWANESWGRYWAWDPKETWALISIIVYAIVLHLHFVPKLNNRYVLNMVSVFAFFSIIMTSFGVNYYLSGLHSYATGDPVPIPKFVYVLVAIVCIISVVAYFKYNSFRAKSKSKN